MSIEITTAPSSTITSIRDALDCAQGSAFVGVIAVFPSKLAPTGWLPLSGQLVSRTTYSNLWNFANLSDNIVTDANWTSLSAYGSFSSGDTSTTFRLPDLRGHFIRGFGTHTDGTSSNSFGIKQEDTFETHTHTFITGNPSSALIGGSGGTRHTNSSGPQEANTGSTGNNETRPTNIALLYCIKY